MESPDCAAHHRGRGALSPPQGERAGRSVMPSGGRCSSPAWCCPSCSRGTRRLSTSPFRSRGRSARIVVRTCRARRLPASGHLVGARCRSTCARTGSSYVGHGPRRAASLLRLAWLVIGIHRLQRLRRAGELALTEGGYEELAALIEAGAEIRRVERLGQPVTFGVLKPAVLLPASLLGRCRSAFSARCSRTSCGTCAAVTGPGCSSRRRFAPRSGSTRRCGGSSPASSRRAKRSSTS